MSILQTTRMTAPAGDFRDDCRGAIKLLKEGCNGVQRQCSAYRTSESLLSRPTQALCGL
eukprot:COSAG02_NODE_7408_length_3030_cov_6.811668_2_plen_59_part_00